MPITKADIVPWSEENFIRGGGPGGQNVNKVASTVQLRFNLAECETIEAPAKARIMRQLQSRITNDGELIVRSNEHRTQERNREAAWARLLTMLNEAARRPKFRVPTRPSRAAKRKRIDTKTKRGAVKALRGRIDPD
ncbi:MAG: aminoacyl-tRNA hydrolase [Hirschia sp.]|nr:aminoacyl-tRNA hydrolase [Hirschia sp.]MBF17958.1 aminoacyl-tRNA hydrolase [Hirschia sp.]|tara:strand:- start:131 stop:541 length:411 start_codon:yes stop_codon:yes gene_type:complete